MVSSLAFAYCVFLFLLWSVLAVYLLAVEESPVMRKGLAIFAAMSATGLFASLFI
jgi:hypothetical protein